MIFTSSLILFLFFLSWSILLRHVASWLLADCKPKSVSEKFITFFDFIATVWWLFAAYKVDTFIPAYFLFLSALWITVHTDLCEMLISRFVSCYLIPFAFFLAWNNFLPISIGESMLTACAAYSFFWITNKIFYLLKKHDGLGQGDLELIAMIGAFLGAVGCWSTILFASLSGTICGCLYLFWTKKSIKYLPFGPFLALGASTFVLYQFEILQYLEL